MTFPKSVVTAQVTVPTSTWVELPGVYLTTVNVYAETAALLVSAGHATPADNRAYKMPAGSSLEIEPPATGKVAFKSITASQTVYLIGA